MGQTTDDTARPLVAMGVAGLDDVVGLAEIQQPLAAPAGDGIDSETHRFPVRAGAVAASRHDPA